MPTQGNDLITWGPGSGSLYIDGLGDGFDSNVYQPYDLSVGMTTGDMLRFEGGRGLFIRLDGWNYGWAGPEASRVTFAGIERVYGSAGDDVVRAGQVTDSGPDGHGISIFAGAGNDNIVATRFGDVLDGGEGNDTIFAGAGDDFVNSSKGDDLIYGGAGQDNIRWGVGSTYDHDPGNDTIFGGEDHDLINVWVTVGNAWGGKVEGGSVNINKVFADGSMSLTASVASESGISRLQAGGFNLGWTHEGDDNVSGANAIIEDEIGLHWNTRWGDDRLVGSSGNDTLEGGHGADTITGGAGDDLISAANDYYSMSAPGDGDADMLIFREGHGHDTVLAFDVGLDVLDPGGRGYTATDTAAGTLLTAGDDTILLAGVHDFEV